MTASAFESLTGAVDVDFPEYETPPPEPIELVRSWLDAAAERGVREPRSLALATADAQGRASNRIVAITSITGEGLVFTTHSNSRKGRELAETGWASGLLYWRETGQQIALSGPVERLDDRRCDELWFARAVPLHAMTAASRQSEPLADPEALRAKADQLAASGEPLPRPDRFAGYHLRASAVEFWCASSDRLHRRLAYELDADRWRVTRLQP